MEQEQQGTTSLARGSGRVISEELLTEFDREMADTRRNVGACARRQARLETARTVLSNGMVGDFPCGTAKLDGLHDSKGIV
jgi:hypothetical protein